MVDVSPASAKGLTQSFVTHITTGVTGHCTLPHSDRNDDKKKTKNKKKIPNLLGCRTFVLRQTQEVSEYISVLANLVRTAIRKHSPNVNPFSNVCCSSNSNGAVNMNAGNQKRTNCLVIKFTRLWNLK